MILGNKVYQCGYQDDGDVLFVSLVGRLALLSCDGHEWRHFVPTGAALNHRQYKKPEVK